MTDQLAQAVAERAARALEWIREEGETPERVVYWIDYDGNEAFDLDLDPEFWFWKLYQRLFALSPVLGLMQDGEHTDINCGHYGKQIDVREAHPIPALCVAIESLEGSGPVAAEEAEDELH